MREQARNKYGELSNEEKDIKREYGRNIYRNISEENKQKLEEYQKNYHEAKKWNKKPSFLISIDKVKTKRIVLSKMHSYDKKRFI